MSDFLLTNRLMLRRALYRLLGTDNDDDALTDNGEAQGEVANYYVQHGLWAAQRYLISKGFREWIEVATPTFSAAAADGTRSADLPADFLRLAGDEEAGLGALVDTDGRPWGGLIHARQKRRSGPYSYWIENGKLYTGRDSNPPTGLSYEYHYRHPTLDSDDGEADPLDFPVDWTPMIPAEGAALAMMEGNFRLSPEQRTIIQVAQQHWRQEAAPWMRKTQEPQKLRAQAVRGSHGIF